MQLTSSVRGRLRAATCSLLAVTAGTVSAANFGTKWQVDGASLVYAENKRTTVFEPLLVIKRNFADGQSLQGKFVFDAMTGASPTGAAATGKVQTFTTPSGQHYQSQVGETPLRHFQDERASADLDWTKPLNRRFTSELGGHLSKETDYASVGATATFLADLNQKLTTISLGGGYNSDRINPVGGVPEGLTRLDPTKPVEKTMSKKIADGMIGVTQILSPRWLAQLNYSYADENGYLTEPYKVISVVDPTSGETASGDYLYEKRPDRRVRQSVFFSTAYHLNSDILHLSYRNYWDDWGIRSNTFDIKYDVSVSDKVYLEPHWRAYHQSAADFYVHSLPRGALLPNYATADYRFGDLTTQTLGAKIGVKTAEYQEFTARIEYMRQSGIEHPSDAIGVQQDFSMFPPIDILILQIGYSIGLP
ncbi:MAG: DUF3570 domain-containing protein [Calditrichaeota bacterium]|nr:DUF3570 domain-containing protein [Calditrichota bacterium]MCB9369635.1 DUF3570 domain-containing protein [Calditrichota bacterium]